MMAAEDLTQRIDQILRDLYVRRAGNCHFNLFWFRSQHLTFQMFYVWLCDQFFRRNGCTPEFWFGRTSPKGPLSDNAPELTRHYELFPWALSASNSQEEVVDAEPITMAARQDKAYPKEYQKANSVVTFWKVDRDKSGTIIVPQFLDSEAVVQPVLMTQLDNAFLQTIFLEWCGSHNGMFKKEFFDLTIIPGQKNSNMLLGPKSQEERDLCDRKCFSWVLSGKNKTTTLFPWKTAILKDADPDDEPFNVDSGENFPDDMFLDPFNTFCSD
ncbi:MAG: hypothetical protein PHQ75_09070 [Thermoguttaceae bacterium]|nr:hypothetical protein [Thermoguttaceae bacterium]